MTTVCPKARNGLPRRTIGGDRYTSYLRLEMNIGEEEEVRLKFEAGAEQRRVLMRGWHK